MNPWTIIGWLTLGALALTVLFWLAGVVLTWLTQHAAHVRTRDDAPRPGDVWSQGGVFIGIDELHIKRIADNGRIVIETELPGGSHASWSDSPEEWQRRVRNRKLWRVS